MTERCQLRSRVPASNLVGVPHAALTPEALRGVIAEHATRAGTDYGAQALQFEEKIAEVEWQLDFGEVVIVFAVGRVPGVPTRQSALPGR